MTWNYVISDDGTELIVWDHTASAGDQPLQTVALDPSNRRPDQREVLDVMYEEAVAAYNNAGGVDQRALNILADAAFEQIERGEP
jgi:hypothetical protein